MSPTDISAGPSTSPQLQYHGHRPYDSSLCTMPEDDNAFDDDNEPDPGMEVDEIGYPKPQLDSQVTGDTLKGGGTPKNFVHKLFGMLADPEAAAYIQWSHDGREFVVVSQEEFAKRILSKHFKHSNFSSFVRQLNMYDFHKINRAPRSQRGTTQPQVWVFSHLRFQRGRPDLLHGIKRKANEGPTVALPFGEDQLVAERRPSLVAGMRSPPNGAAMNQEAMILDLQRKNEELSERLQRMEHNYKELDRKLQTVLDRIQPRTPSQQLLDTRQPVRAAIAARTSSQHDEQVPHFDYNVPQSIGAVPGFQQQHGDGLESPQTDSQSSVDQFQSAGPPSAFVSPSPVSGSSGIPGSSSTDPLHNTHLSLSPLGINSGSSGYQPLHHQPNPVSQQNIIFQGLSSFNIYDPGSQQVAGRPNQNFPSGIPQTISTSQSRINLGGRGHPVMMTPQKSGPLATVPPKGQPPDSNGGLYR